MKTIIIISTLALVAYLFVACNDNFDIRQAYDFSLTTLPVQKQITKGETAEIRCTLNRSGEFDGAQYSIRYFQRDGKGTLTMDNGMVLLPNDSYPIDRQEFRLYYTSDCEDTQQIDLTVTDNFGQRFDLSLSFQNANK